jgi:hypothetical protein
LRSTGGGGGGAAVAVLTGVEALCTAGVPLAGSSE